MIPIVDKHIVKQVTELVAEALEEFKKEIGIEDKVYEEYDYNDFDTDKTYTQRLLMCSFSKMLMKDIIKKIRTKTEFFDYELISQESKKSAL